MRENFFGRRVGARWLLNLAICCALFIAAARTRPVQHSEHSAHQATGPIPAELLQRAITLHSGIGDIHQKVTTSSPEAQEFYDQGLAYLHSYMWIEAARSFHQALRSDPQLAMAWVGLADVFIGLQNVPAAQNAEREAIPLGQRISENEQAWIVIRDREIKYLKSNGSPEAYFAYRQTIYDALKLNPDDPWLWIQRGLADEGSPLAHGQAGGVDTLSFYGTAIALDPNNFVAHHYYAHTLENLGFIQQALAEASDYERLAPEVPHAHHMRGHELLRLGRTDEAIQEFLKAKQLEEQEYRAEDIPARYDWHYSHNLQLLGMAYQSLGQMKAAEGVFREAFSLPAYTEFLDYNRREWPEFLLRRGRFDEALDAAHQMQRSQWPMPRLAGHTLAGEALLALRRTNDAKAELVAAEHEAQLLPPNVAAALPYPAILRANLLLAENPREGERLMKNIEGKILASPGVDAWSAARFELDSIASAARRLGAWNLAAFTAQQMIAHDSNYAGGYFALGMAAEHASMKEEAQRNFAAAEKLWNEADADLSELKLIRQMLVAPR